MEGKEKASALSRRSFLKMAALASGAAATGSMLSACSSIGEAQVHAGVEETVCMTYCNACMGCPLEAVVRNDNVVFTRAAEIPDTDRDIKRMCARGASIPVQLVEGKRIKYPMKRVEGTERGAGQWERISWDEAINTICEKIKGYQNEFGKSSVCAFTYGTTEPRNLYNLYRLENLAEFSHQERTTDFALAQASIREHRRILFPGGNDWDIIESCKTFVVWGHNPIVSWPNTWRAIANAIENNGCKLVVVDPNYNTIAQKSDLFVSVRPGTDGALALGIAAHNNAQPEPLPQPRHIVAVSPGEVPWNDAEKVRMQALNERDVSIDYAFMVTVEKFMRHGCENVPDYMLSGSRGDFTGVGDIHFFYSADEVLYGALPDFEKACKRANVPIRCLPARRWCIATVCCQSSRRQKRTLQRSWIF